MNKKIVLIAILICTMFASFAHAGSTFSRIKTWSSGQTLTAGDLNAEFDNVLNNLDPSGIDDESGNATAMQATADPYPGAAISQPTSLQGEIQRLRYQIAAILGETYWYIDPDTSLSNIGAYSSVIANSAATSTYGILVANTSGIDDTYLTSSAAGQVVDQGGGNDVKFKILNIGDWDMNVSVAGSASATVAHGLTAANIRSVSASIRPDSDQTQVYYQVPAVDGSGADVGVPILFFGQALNGVQEAWDSTNIYLGQDTTSGDFDNSNFNETSYNRGWITIIYTE